MLFKCISKIIANRIKHSLKDLISSNQSAFVPGRSISDNILLTQELMHNYHLDRGTPRCAFKEGRLSVKYLGIPLVSSRLMVRDCKELVEKVQNRVHDWKNKALSSDVRLQLCASVLGSMHIYWASVFMLPSRVLLNIEQIMRGFLWSHGDIKKGKAKVAWEVVCFPKDEGGLGLRRLEHFNSALMVSHVWKLLSLKESLWVRWIHAYKLNGRSFWDIPLCGNGANTSLWYDRWCDLGPLSNRISTRDMFGAGLNLSTKVWSSIRPRGDKVDWFNIVWFNFCIPRHAFNLWLIVKRKLKTQDMIRSWEVSDSLGTDCALCETTIDSHEHLFFLCSFSQAVWSHMVRLTCLNLVNHDIYAKRRTIKSIIVRLVIAASAYYIWQERNWRLFRSKKRMVSHVIDYVVSSVWLKLLSCKLKKSKDGQKLFFPIGVIGYVMD
nr:hypothetical protein [Tanacetum cinerariifolium]